jgi:hypothetical protein
MLANTPPGSLVQANGCGWSFHESMNVPMVSVSWRTEVNEPRRMAWRVMTEKKHSTRFSQEYPVGVKCRVTRGFFASQALTSACLWVA